MKELPPQYDPKATEGEIYNLWEKGGYFKPEARSKKQEARKTYAIHLPPPNVTGSLHMGHALNATISDVLIRYHRMKGFKTVWFPGTDHAGIATQRVVEKQLQKEGTTRWKIGREKFIERVWQWKEEYGNKIISQLKKLGASADWSRLRFTMDDDYAKEVKKAFLHYHKKGLIYRGKRVVSWCPKCFTSLSDLEIEYKQEKGKLWYVKYPLQGKIATAPRAPRDDKKSVIASEAKQSYIIVATTRPETMLGDSAVAVHPKDKRYKNLIGKKVLVPLTNHSPSNSASSPFKSEWWREIPIVADEAIDMSFGTGAVKVTPAHDMLDAEIGERHKLAQYQVIDEQGKMTAEAGKEFEGLKVNDAREKVVAKLEEAKLIEKTEDLQHNLATCYRCGTTLEPLLSNQWFLRMAEPPQRQETRNKKQEKEMSLRDMVLKAFKNKKVKITPKNFEKIATAWLENIKDWNISRQIWWGHQLPVWFRRSLGSSREAAHFKKKALYKKLSVKNDAEFNEFSDKLLINEKEKIDWASSKEDEVQIGAGYINVLKERDFIDDEWIKKFRINKQCLNEEYFIGEAAPKPIGWIQSTDVLDTWFSSALWPFAGLSKEDLKEFYPSNILITARDIINLWVTRMVFSGQEFMKKDPFPEVLIHATILTKDGKRMSKSLGTGIDPLELIDKYGADATRFGIIWQAMGTQDIRWDESAVVAGKKFANKLWNIARFCQSKIGGRYTIQDARYTKKDDKEILKKLENLKKSTEKKIKGYEFGQALHDIYDFVWHEFADKYIEHSKGRNDESAKMVLGQVVADSLKLLHPFMPFITEEIHQRLFADNGAALIVKEW